MGQTHFSLSPQVSGAWAGHVSARVPPGSASTLHSSFLRSCHPGAFCSDAKPQFSSSKKEIHGACPDTQRIGHQEPAAQPVHTRGLLSKAFIQTCPSWVGVSGCVLSQGAGQNPLSWRPLQRARSLCADLRSKAFERSRSLQESLAFRQTRKQSLRTD